MRDVARGEAGDERQPSPRRLLIVDRDAESAAELDALVASRGYETAYAGNAASAVEECRAFSPDLAIVDLDMTEPEALRLGLKFVDVVKLPFIVYSQVTDVLSRVVALQLGADNVLSKPMEQRLLLAHLDAAMRRIEHNLRHSRYATFEEFGPYQINRTNRNVRYRGNAVRLSGTEFELFWVLANHFGEIVDRRHVIETLGLSDDEVIGRTIDQRISACATAWSRRARRKTRSSRFAARASS